MAKTKDLGIKIGTKEEAYWTEVKRAVDDIIESLEKQLKLQKAIIELAKQKIKEEVNRN